MKTLRIFPTCTKATPSDKLTEQEVIWLSGLKKLAPKIKAAGWRYADSRIDDNDDAVYIFVDTGGQRHYLHVTKDGVPYFPPVQMTCV
jgi:hypothetical protein